MNQTFTFHHIGYATKSINNTLPIFLNMGYSASTIYKDDIQKVKICLLENNNGPIIELVEGMNKNDSPIKKIIDKIGVTPYHICYLVDNLKESVEILRNQKFILLFDPVKAIAFSNRKICYLYNSNFGLIELLENEISSI